MTRGLALLARARRAGLERARRAAFELGRDVGGARRDRALAAAVAERWRPRPAADPPPGTPVALLQHEAVSDARRREHARQAAAALVRAERCVAATEAGHAAALAGVARAQAALDAAEAALAARRTHERRERERRADDAAEDQAAAAAAARALHGEVPRPD